MSIRLMYEELHMLHTALSRYLPEPTLEVARMDSEERPAALVQFREQSRQLKQRMHAELAYAASVQIQPEDS